MPLHKPFYFLFNFIIRKLWPISKLHVCEAYIFPFDLKILTVSKLYFLSMKVHKPQFPH